MTTPKKSLKLSTPVASRSLTRSQSLHRCRSLTPKRLSPVTRTPSKRRTPRGVTPGGDRFMPIRKSMELNPTQLSLSKEPETPEKACETTAAQDDYAATLKESLFQVRSEGKVLCYKQKAPRPQSSGAQHRVLYSQQSVHSRTSNKTARRNIPQIPTRILDAPDIIDDYYLNLLDWSSSNILAVALARAVYLWNADSGSIDLLFETSDEEEYVSALKWGIDGTTIAIGLSNGKILIWDANTKRQLRSITSHRQRVTCLSWNPVCPTLLSSGSQDGTIVNNDVSAANAFQARLTAHSQEVCGLEWSCDGTQLASGANDNTVCIWDVTKYDEPRFQLTRHTAAVKAIAWCPHRPNLLATGGGTADRHIRFWNTLNGQCVKEVDTKSQVCSIMWSKNYRDEIISSHGFSQNQLCVWKYPKMTKITELTGHSARVLHLAMSPDGETVASAAADETLRFWKVFERSSCRSSSAHGIKSGSKVSPARMSKRKGSAISGLNLR